MTIELGQLLHNNPVGLECPAYVEALCAAIRKELARVYWNVNQKPWRGSGRGDIGGEEANDWLKSSELSCEPLPPGIEWREYYNWGGSPEDPDWNQAEADKPNFSFEGVEIRWYKYFGRSMNVNVDWSPEKWVDWFNQCLGTIRQYEEENSPLNILHRKNREPEGTSTP